MQVSIRIAGSDDARAVSEILVDSYPALMAGAYDPRLLARALPLITRPQPRLLAGGSYFLAEADGAPAGCGGWSFGEPFGGAVEPGLAHIRHFAVRSAWARRGIGRALYERCASEARKTGVSCFEAQSSLNGEPFYAALGFVRLAEIEVPLAPDLAFPSILMRSDL